MPEFNTRLLNFIVKIAFVSFRMCVCVCVCVWVCVCVCANVLIAQDTKMSIEMNFTNCNRKYS
jgi:hypothetical protein